jgi:hypothetical protein
MIKFSAILEDGRPMVGLGVDEGNCQRLSEGCPIVFPASEVGFDDDRKIVIVYDDDDFQSAMDNGGFDGAKVFCCLVIDDDGLAALRGGTTLSHKTKMGDFVLMYAKTLAELEKLILPFIDETTKVKRTGFSPSAPRFREQN